KILHAPLEILSLPRLQNLLTLPQGAHILRIEQPNEFPAEGTASRILYHHPQGFEAMHIRPGTTKQATTECPLSAATISPEVSGGFYESSQLLHPRAAQGVLCRWLSKVRYTRCV